MGVALIQALLNEVVLIRTLHMNSYTDSHAPCRTSHSACRSSSFPYGGQHSPV